MQDTIHKSTTELIVINSVTVENQTEHKINLEKVAKLVGFLRAELRLPAQLGVDVTFVSKDVIEDLHLKHMNDPGPTDVLSFPMDSRLDGPVQGPMFVELIQSMLGDIVICPGFALSQMEAIAANSGDARVSIESEFIAHIEMLVTHSMLHLIGYDHPDEATRAAMFAKQDNLLASFDSEFYRCAQG